MPIFLIRWSAAHRSLVIGISVALAMLGLWTLPWQQVDATPDVSDPQVILYAKWEQPPDLVEAQVTYPLTTALQDWNLRYALQATAGVAEVATVGGVEKA